MDVNGTRYHLLLGRDDWGRCTDDRGAPVALEPPGASALTFDAGRGVLTLAPLLFQFRDAPRDDPPSIDDRRGAARDRFGNWYWIDETSRSILVRSSGSDRPSTFWPPDPLGEGPSPLGAFASCRPPEGPDRLRFAGLAVTDDHHLVVGVSEPGGVLLFDLHAGGPPLRMTWPRGIPFAPFDLAPAPGGGVWILDRLHARYWGLDRRFRPIRTDQEEAVLRADRLDDFQPIAEGPPRRVPARAFPTGIPLAVAVDGTAVDPIAIEALPDGSVLILERVAGSAFSLIRRYRFGSPLGAPLSTELIRAILDDPAGSGVRLVAHDLAYAADPGGGPGTLYVASASGNQSFAFELSIRDDRLDLSATPTYLPMRRFGGKAVVSSGGVAYYDFADAWVPLVAQRRPRHRQEGALRSPIFDGREPGCVWHRLMLDGSLPSGSEIRVWSRSADDPAMLAVAGWDAEPEPYRRRDGSELSALGRRRDEGEGTWELLFQRARGRYLQLRLRLSGDGRCTPGLRALRAYSPRFSYLGNYLPAIYREEEGSASFLDRFLANFEGFFTTIEDRVAGVHRLFDLRTAPPDALDWLASWLGVVLDPAWDEGRRRLFLRHAMEIFRLRGTTRGILVALRLAFEECADDSILEGDGERPASIRIVEWFRTRQIPGADSGAAVPIGPRREPRSGSWQPAHGGESLHRRYRDRVVTPDAPGHATAEFPVLGPEGSVEPKAWRRFARDELGFIPSATGSDLGAWRAFLARRYGRIQRLNDAYRLIGPLRHSSFEEVPLPDRLPADGEPLRDWYQFESIVLAMGRTAHQFTVLLPASPSLADTPEEMQRRLELATRIVMLEKPAHTAFDVKFYWSAFRIGDARLGFDTLVDLGGRAPGLLGPMALGRGHLAESSLVAGHPQDIPDRFIVGRDAPGCRPLAFGGRDR